MYTFVKSYIHDIFLKDVAVESHRFIPDVFPTPVEPSPL
jgi:hypothetical protein